MSKKFLILKDYPCDWDWRKDFSKGNIIKLADNGEQYCLKDIAGVPALMKDVVEKTLNILKR